MSFNPGAQRRISETYNDDEYGMWEVRGADQNPCMGGSHHQPLLGYYEGRYGDVLAYAKELPSWYSWGTHGGTIKKITTKKIGPDSVKHRQNLKAKQKALEEDLMRIKNELKT